MKSLKVQKLTRDYNGFRAVDGITFETEPGEIFGFFLAQMELVKLQP